MRRPTRSLIAAVATAAMLVAAGCTGTENQSGTGSEGRVDYLNLGGFGGGSNPQPNYNPYLEATRLEAINYLFEPLIQFDNYGCEAKPWLATKWEWKDPSTLVFTMRDGVKWNDGQAFTAKDVEFTFNMLKQHKALDLRGLWRYLSAVTAPDDKTAEFKFNGPGAGAFTEIDDVKIVPKHIWEKQTDPVTFVNADNPVGTGPFTVKSFNGQQLVIARSPGYWQADKVRVDEVRFNNDQTDQQIKQLQLSRGEFDSNAIFVPDIQKTYVERDPKNNHYWYPADANISLYLNLTKAPFNDVAFRRALLTAITRQEIADKAQFGYVKPASQTGIKIPNQEDFIPADIANKGVQPFDTAKADRELTAAGYTKSGDGKRLDKSGKPIAFKFAVPGDWTDWVAAQKIIIENLTALGFQITQDGPAFPSYENDRAIGNYDAVLGVYGGSCNMYRNYQEALSSDVSAPIGQKAVSNFVRWNDPRTDELIDKLFAAQDKDAQKPIVADLAKIMMEQVPVIPLWYGARWFQYSTKKATGWPNEKDPYGMPTDNLLWITNLKPAG
ncbi:ABC transporter substrate-binding protein [Virgisporangium aurantiacum]